MAASEVKAVKDWIKSQHMQDVFKRVNAMSTAPLEGQRLDLDRARTGDQQVDVASWPEADVQEPLINV
jgi:hypothetical protein